MKRIKQSIQSQLWFLFSIIFLFNLISVGVLVSGWIHNTACVADIESNVAQSREISGITEAHINWVNQLNSHLQKGTAFTGSLDHTTCSFGTWASALTPAFKSDNIIAAALNNINDPHTLIHNKAAEIIELNKIDPEAAYSAYEHNILPNVLTIIQNLNTISGRYNDLTFESVNTSADLLQRNSVIQLIIIALVLIVSVMIALLIIRLTIKPIKKIEAAFEQLAQGNLHTSVEYDSADEMGRMADLINQTMQGQSVIMGDLIEKFTKISQGDLQIEVDIPYPGDFGILKETIIATVERLNSTMRTIHEAAEQVGSGAHQVASGAQELATGSTEQSTTIEELNVAVAQIAAQAEENLSTIVLAAKYIEQAGNGVNTSNQYMQDLSEAMNEITAASDQITNITKVIEDIAFQTNILALNAAIEAARAGNAGKGFAVVADEVRNLAAKSAEAARQTSALIAASANTVEKGTQIAGQTAQALADTGINAQRLNESFAKIEQASSAQTYAIEQIKDGIEQVSAVVQTNAATAEENSATSEEMSAQASTLREEVDKFRLKEGPTKRMPAPNYAVESLKMPAHGYDYSFEHATEKY